MEQSRSQRQIGFNRSFLNQWNHPSFGRAVRVFISLPRVRHIPVAFAWHTVYYYAIRLICSLAD
jgi:hypothetical protein